MRRPLSLVLLGLGRMGRLVDDIARDRGHAVVARLGREDSERALPQGTDVAIDFSRAEAVLANARRAAEAGCDLVVGTTGWDRAAPARAELAALAERAGIGVVAAPNFSFGMFLFRRMAEHAARLAALDEDLDAWIEEAHHRGKADHPSGTALALANTVLGALPGKTSILSQLPEGPVPPDGLVVAVSRGGHVPGTHRLVLDGPDETITLEHAARSRRAFASGAVRAAEWVRGRKGIFTLDHVLSTGDTP